MKKSLLEFDNNEMKSLMLSLNERSFRAKQITDGLFSGKKFDEMSNISAELKARLNENFSDIPVEIEKKFVSKDGTVKYLFRLLDGELIEGVLMTYKYGKTLCISTQIGCRMRCAFCASGLDGLKRNLTTAEMLGQVVVVNRENLEDGSANETQNRRSVRAVTNVVLMGSGEPLDNYENVVKFLRLISAPYTLNMGGRNLSLSTSGLSDKILEISELGFQFNMTISLHAPNDQIRSAIMPINKKYGIKSVISAAKKYFEKTGRRLIFEYSLIGGVNDGRENALELCRLLKGVPCHVNLIRLNTIDESELKSSSKESAEEFWSVLKNAGISSTTRRIMGADIDGACGQLRRRYGDANI
jgi:23S rRNA (adenine2503-C2)-methyltransferase